MATSCHSTSQGTEKDSGHWSRALPDINGRAHGVSRVIRLEPRQITLPTTRGALLPTDVRNVDRNLSSDTARTIF